MPIDLVLARELRARGDQTRSLERGVERGLFVRVRPGVYAVGTEWAAADDRTRHRAAMDAFVATSTRVPVFSLESAALLHGIPVVGGWPAVPHTVASDLGHVPPKGVLAHRPRHPWLTAEIGGMLATTPECTAIDLAAARPLLTGVAAFDYVLARGASKSDLFSLIESWRPFHGVRRATRALEIATGLAETPLESISLVPIALAGLEKPEQQVEVVVRGRLYRLDFLWRQQQIVGEADGRLKYRSAEELWAEKVREDALRSTGLRVARWGWDEAWAGSPVISRLAEAGLHPGPARATRA